MLSIKRNLRSLIKTAISKAFPLQEETVVKEITDRGDIYEYDYLCEAPKQIFDKHKVRYRMRNIFYGLSTFKEVGDDLKDQIPRNEFVEKVQVNQNGTIKLRIKKDFILENLRKYQTFIGNKDSSKIMICLPGLVLENNIGYDYFRAINRAESLRKVCEVFNCKAELVFPFLRDSNGTLEDASSEDPKIYSGLFNNSLFNFDPTYLSLAKAMKDSPIFETINESLAKGETAHIRAYCFSLLWRTLAESNKDVPQLLMISPAKMEGSYKDRIHSFNKNLDLSAQIINQHYFGDLLLLRKDKFKEPTADLSLLNDSKNEIFEHLKATIQNLKDILKQDGTMLNDITEISLLRTLKLMENFSDARSPLKVSPQILLEFISTKLRLFDEAKEYLERHAQNGNNNIVDEDWTDLERHIAINLLRINEKFEEVLETGEIKVLFTHLENLAKLWINVSRTGKLETMKNRNILIEHTLYLFTQFGL